MSHHRQQLPGFGENPQTRLRKWRNRLRPVGSRILGPGFIYQQYPWKPVDMKREVWKQDFAREPTPDEKVMITDTRNWWLWSDDIATENPDGTFEDLEADKIVAGVAGGRYRVKVFFKIEGLPIKNIKAVWASSPIQKLARRGKGQPIEINVMRGEK